MAKQNTRVDTKTLAALVAAVIPAVQAARNQIGEQFPRLSKAQRKLALRPPKAFAQQGLKLLQASKDAPEVGALVNFNAEAVSEDLDNLRALYPLQREIDLIKQVVDDAVLLSGDESYREALAFHSVAKPASARRPELEEIVAQLGAMFDAVRSQPDMVDEDADEALEP